MRADTLSVAYLTGAQWADKLPCAGSEPAHRELSERASSARGWPARRAGDFSLQTSIRRFELDAARTEATVEISAQILGRSGRIIAGAPVFRHCSGGFERSSRGCGLRSTRRLPESCATSSSGLRQKFDVLSRRDSIAAMPLLAFASLVSASPDAAWVGASPRRERERRAAERSHCRCDPCARCRCLATTSYEEPPRYACLTTNTRHRRGA